jgi:hypothetical protein
MVDERHHLLRLHPGPIGHQKKDWEVLDPPAEVTQQIQRCLISPVDIPNRNGREILQFTKLS